CSSRHSASQGNSRLGRRVRRPLQRQSKIGTRTLGQEFQRRAVRISKLPGNVQAQPGPAWPRGEERLEYLRPQLGRNARAVVGKLGYYGIAHISGTAHDVDAAVLLLAVLPCVAHQVPYDLAQVAAIEQHVQLARTLDDHARGRDVLGLHDFLDQRVDEFRIIDDLRLLADAAIELQHFADDAIDALGVVA